MPERTDRELLELAAKAAGIERPAGIRSDNTWWWYNSTQDREGLTWNPLTDDGDALRLAVKLGMSVSVFNDAIGIGCRKLPGQKYEEFPLSSDACADTRSAITKTAAEIGANMQS